MPSLSHMKLPSRDTAGGQSSSKGLGSVEGVGERRNRGPVLGL